jgi:hypothetical protein
MRYLCLIYIDEAKRDALPPGELAAMGREAADYIEELKASGRHIAAEPLESVSTATCVRVRNGVATVTDGPFAETKEQLGGFFLIDARDLNEALLIAQKIPPARLGTIEVRAVRNLAEYVESLERRSTSV